MGGMLYSFYVGIYVYIYIYIKLMPCFIKLVFLLNLKIFSKKHQID